MQILPLPKKLTLQQIKTAFPKISLERQECIFKKVNMLSPPTDKSTYTSVLHFYENNWHNVFYVYMNKKGVINIVVYLEKSFTYCNNEGEMNLSIEEQIQQEESFNLNQKNIILKNYGKFITYDSAFAHYHIIDNGLPSGNMEIFYTNPNNNVEENNVPAFSIHKNNTPPPVSKINNGPTFSVYKNDDITSSKRNQVNINIPTTYEYRFQKVKYTLAKPLSNTEIINKLSSSKFHLGK